MQITIAFLRSKSNPCGARPVPAVQAAPGSGNFNPRAPCGARLCRLQAAGGPINFNPRAPCGARRRGCRRKRYSYKFQSSRPLRGATGGGGGTQASSATFQSSRPLQGATSSGSPGQIPAGHFNPRAPCGARRQAWISSQRMAEFQSSRPLRGATPLLQLALLQGGISILAPLAGRDSAPARWPGPAPRNFNPRAPCGARRLA